MIERNYLIMNQYEQITPTCQMIWREKFDFTSKKYTQVSGYIFNESHQLLIVKNEDTWTIPGGHPESGETILETLNRELNEEACITIQEPYYLGAVEVVENNQIYYQLRYTALVKDILPFKQEWEISERKFINLNDLPKYITWSQGITFQAQLQSVNNHWHNHV